MTIINVQPEANMRQIFGFLLFYLNLLSTILRADAKSRPMARSAVELLNFPGVLVTFTFRLLMYCTSRSSKPVPPLDITFNEGRESSR